MKHWWGLAMMVFLAAGPVVADEAPGVPRQVIVRMDVISMSPALARELKQGGRESDAQWQQLMTKSQAKIVQTIQFAVMIGSRATMLVGHKDPLVYYDEKAQDFQIQYVDTGVKLQAKVEDATSETVSLEVQPDVSLIQLRRAYSEPPNPVTWPQTSCIQANQRITALPYGETVVVARAHGSVVKSFWNLLAVPEGLPVGNDLILAISVQRP